MTIIELKERIDKIIEDVSDGADLNSISVLIDCSDTNIGAKISEEIASVNMGFDWETGQVRITPSMPLFHQQTQVVAKTSAGDIIAEKSDDPNFPGIAIEIRGEDINDTFLKNAMSLAWVEYSTEDNTLRVVVYGDGNEEDYTDLIKIINYRKQDKLTIE